MVEGQPRDLQLRSGALADRAHQGRAPACLRAVDGIQFVFDAAVPDGQTGGGILSIDDVVLQ